MIHCLSHAEKAGKSGFAIASDASVFLLVPSGEKKIHHYKSSGVLIGKFGDEGPLEGQLLAPIDMTMYKNKLYVLDLFGPQIKVFSSSGKLLNEFGNDLPKDQKPEMRRRIRWARWRELRTGTREVMACLALQPLARNGLRCCRLSAWKTACRSAM